MEIIPLATLLLFSCLSFSVFIGFQTLVQIHKEAFIIKKDERPSPIKLFLTSYRKTGHRVWCFFVFAIIFALIFGSYITEETIVHELRGEEIDIKSQEIQWTFKILYTLTLSSITIGYLIAFLFISKSLYEHRAYNKERRIEGKISRLQKKLLKIKNF